MISDTIITEFNSYKKYNNEKALKKTEAKKLCINGLYCFNYNTHLCCNNYQTFELEYYCDL